MRHSPEMGPEPLPTAPTRRQTEFLVRNNLVSDFEAEVRPPDYHEASHRINSFISQRRRLAPTPKQEALLKQRGKWKDGMTRGEAFDEIRRLMWEDQRS